jgi:hypothetical protein
LADGGYELGPSPAVAASENAVRDKSLIDIAGANIPTRTSDPLEPLSGASRETTHRAAEVRRQLAIAEPLRRADSLFAKSDLHERPRPEWTWGDDLDDVVQQLAINLAALDNQKTMILPTRRSPY